jgi:DNA-binding response OmpR family regulator
MAGMVVALARMTAVKALVISADPALRRQLRVALGAVGRRTGGSWEALEAENGIVGLRMAWRELPDLVVADEIASGAGGFAVAKDLRGAQEPFPGAIILVLARRQDEWLAKWAGADAWVTKPFDPFVLADMVAEQLNRRQMATGVA